nr:uncharacterized protein LOC110355067 isoform X2 [Columba livia]
MYKSSPKWWQTRGCQVEHLLPALLRSRAEGAMGRMRTGPGLVAGGGCRGAELVLLPLLLRLHLRAWDSVYLSKEERKPRWSWCEAERVCTESDEVYRRPEGSGSGGHLCTIFLVPHDTGLCCVKSSPSCHALLVLTTTSPAQVSIPASPPPLRVKIWELWVQRNELRPLICCSSYSRMAPCTVPWQHQLPVPDGTRYLRLLSQLLFLILLPVISAIKHTFAVPAKTVQVTSATEHLLALSWLPHPTGSDVSACPGSSRFLRMVRQAEQQQEPIPLNRFIS